MRHKKLLTGLAATAVIIGLNSYTLLKTFVIPEVQTTVVSTTTENVAIAAELAAESTDSASTASTSSGSEQTETASSEVASPESASETVQTQSETETSLTQSAAQVSETSYSDENIQITLSTIREYNTNIYIAEVTLSDASLLKTALARSAFGTNVTETTSSMAESNNAILAINGDYYGADRSGYVIKNGVIYRNTVRSDSQYPDLAVYADGSFKIIYETDITAEELLAEGVVNLFAFGPSLIENGEVSVDENTEVKKAMNKNPRTAIGIIDDLHYILVVSDGRTSESEGLSLYELANIMKTYGVTTAYNLDGGGSSTMYFNGTVVNNPTTNGRRISEREVSDIVYIGY